MCESSTTSRRRSGHSGEWPIFRSDPDRSDHAHSVIHPLVLLSVVDHAARVPLPNKKRVLGVLLGQDDGHTINVANSFAVPFEEDDKDPKTFFLDLDYVEEMWRMFRKVNGES